MLEPRRFIDNHHGSGLMVAGGQVAEAWRLGRLDELPDPNLKGEYDGAGP